MILGYVLFDEAGLVILSRELVPLIESEKQSIFTSVITALGNLMDKIFSSKPKYLELENLHLYFSFGEKFSILLISDIEDDRLAELSNKIINKISSLALSSFDVQIDQKLKEKMKGEIEKVIFTSPPSIRSIKKLANILNATLNTKKGEILGFERVVPEVHKLGIISKFKQLFKGKAKLPDLLYAFYNGQLEEIIERAPSLFNDIENGDLAKIIYCKAALLLNSFDPRVEAPPLNDIKLVIDKIKDKFAKEFLKAELESFIKLGAYNRRRELFINHHLEVFQKLMERDLEGEIYAILINAIPYGPVLDYLENHFKDRSDYLLVFVQEMKFLLDFLVRRPDNLDEIFILIGRFKNEFEEAYQKGSPKMYNLSHMLQFALIWGLLEKTVSPNDGEKLLVQFFEFFNKYRGEIIDQGLRSTNRHKAVNIYFAFNIVYRLLIELNYGEALKSLDEYFEYVKKKTEWFIGLGKTHRIMLDMYYVSVAGALSILTRLALEKNIFFSDIPRIVMELADPKMEEFWNFNEYHFAHYYSDLLEAIGNTAHFIEYEDIKRNIFLQVAYGLERIAKIFKNTAMIHDIECLKAIRFYLLSGTNEGKEKAKTLVEELKKVSSKFLINLAEKLLEKYGGLS